LNLRDALALLGVTPESSPKTVRTNYHDLMRRHHPDVADLNSVSDSPVLDPAILTEAYALVVAEFSKTDGAKTSGNDLRQDSGPQISHSFPTVVANHDGDTIWIEAPPDEAYQRLLDAAAYLGGIGHVDRTNELLEVIVRFEGGPSCSLLMTLQGRIYGTEIFCEIESIEALPAPPLAPVLDELVNLLNASHQASAS
jgi:hypothetical protein